MTEPTDAPGVSSISNDENPSGFIKDLRQISAVRDYLTRINAEPRSIRTAVACERQGKYWSDVAVIRFAKDGKVTAPADYIPTEGEEDRIAAGFSAVRFPKHKRIATVSNVPTMVSEARAENVFELRDADDNIIMLQVRVVREAAKAISLGPTGLMVKDAWTAERAVLPLAWGY